MNRIFSLLLYFVYILLIFVILPVVLGADKLDSLKIFIYAIVFFIFPGYAFLRYTGFTNANYIEAFIYSLIIGIAYHSFVFTLLFVVGLEKYQYATLLVPFVLAVMVHNNRQPVLTAKAVVMDEKFNSSLIIIVFVSVIISLYWILSAPDIDDHLVSQGIIIQTLKNGFPLLDPYVDGMSISYNFLSHLLLFGMHLQTDVDIDMLISKIAPIWFMVLAILSVFLFSVKLLRINVFFTLLAIISVFWVVGYADINTGLFGIAVVTSATRVLSSLFAFTLYFLALTWFSLYTKVKFKLKIAPCF